MNRKRLFCDRVASVLERRLGVTLEREVLLDPLPDPIDLVSRDRSLAVECGVYNWTASGRLQSTTITAIRTSLRRLAALPAGTRRVLALARDIRPPQSESVAGYFVRMEGRAIHGITVVEIDEKAEVLRVLAGSLAAPARETT